MSGFDRERHLKPLLAGGLALLLLCGYWGYSSYRQSLSRLTHQTESAQRELAQLRGDLQEFRKLNAELQSLSVQQTTATGGNLIATVENAAQQIGARSQLLYVRPQPDKKRDNLIEEGVEIKLEKLVLDQLVELLYRFESTQQKLRISQLRIRTRFGNPDQLDAVLSLSRLREQP